MKRFDLAKEGSMYTLGSEEWLQAFADAINNSPGYAEAAKTWEGDFYIIIDAGEGVDEEIVMYLDLWHGKCREAFIASDRSVKAPEFVISASESNWRKVVDKQLDPIQGMMTRQLKLKGNMVKIMKAVKAAKELVDCVTRVPTKFHI
jgi:putative sterol carrier protein